MAHPQKIPDSHPICPTCQSDLSAKQELSYFVSADSAPVNNDDVYNLHEEASRLVHLLGALAQAGPLAVAQAHEVMNTVPENWIPFIPVHVENSNREIQLQRAAMPRILEGDPDRPEKVRPRTMLLRKGLDRTPAKSYFLHEEEVLGAGVRVTQAFQRARWRNGQVFVWLGVRKQTGRGEGHSGLVFDRIVDIRTKDGEL